MILAKKSSGEYQIINLNSQTLRLIANPVADFRLLMRLVIKALIEL